MKQKTSKNHGLLHILLPFSRLQMTMMTSNDHFYDLNLPPMAWRFSLKSQICL